MREPPHLQILSARPRVINRSRVSEARQYVSAILAQMQQICVYGQYTKKATEKLFFHGSSKQQIQLFDRSSADPYNIAYYCTLHAGVACSVLYACEE